MTTPEDYSKPQSLNSPGAGKEVNTQLLIDIPETRVWIWDIIYCMLA